MRNDLQHQRACIRRAEEAGEVRDAIVDLYVAHGRPIVLHEIAEATGLKPRRIWELVKAGEVDGFTETIAKEFAPFPGTLRRALIARGEELVEIAGRAER